MKGVDVKVDKLAQVVQGINELVKKAVLVGIPESTTEREADSGPMNNATLGYIHEHGAPSVNIPARPFLVPGVEESADKINARMKKAADAALSGNKGKIESELEAAGLMAQNGVKAKINSGAFAPLDESTLKARARRGRKGAQEELNSRAAGNQPNPENARPLIDTGQLRDSITYVIRGKK